MFSCKLTLIKLGFFVPYTYNYELKQLLTITKNLKNEMKQEL